MDYNIFGELNNELDEFFNSKVHVAGVQKDDSARYLTAQNKGYDFSQWEMVNLINLYYNSKFETGRLDSEGQQKIFLNICKFRADVASKQIDLDVKDFHFVPEEGADEWPSFFANIEFSEWAKEKYLGDLINTSVELFPRFGVEVLKKVGNELEHVPIETLRNQQDAECLNTARYVIIEHPNMTLDEMKEMKGWDTSGIDMDFGDKQTVFERYAKVPLSFYKKQKNQKIQDGDYKESIDCLAILTLSNKKGQKPDGGILFLEEVKKRPFQEVHWARQHGRWMGVGEIENQLENQRGANMSFNLFRRQLLWSSKKIFQSASDTIARNLVKDVKDGEVLEVGVNGQITPIDMSNRAIGDFSNFQQILEKNSDQKSFTYEVATGEALPSGTPFRLGVVLSNAVNSHFDLKREKLGSLYKKAIVEFILPSFQKENSKEHTLALFSDSVGFELLKHINITANVNKALTKAILDHKAGDPIPNIEEITQGITDILGEKRNVFATIPEEFYATLPKKVKLVVTGEEIDIPKKIETLTNLYTSLVQMGDVERADRILRRILSYTGESMDLLAGAKSAPAMPAQPIPSPIQGSSLNQPTTPNQTL